MSYEAASVFNTLLNQEATEDIVLSAKKAQSGKNGLNFNKLLTLLGCEFVIEGSSRSIYKFTYNGQSVAIKVACILDGFSQNRREASLLKEIDGFHVPILYYVHPTNLYIICEFIGGCWHNDDFDLCKPSSELEWRVDYLLRDANPDINIDSDDIEIEWDNFIEQVVDSYVNEKEVPTEFKLRNPLYGEFSIGYGLQNVLHLIQEYEISDLHIGNFAIRNNDLIIVDLGS